MEDGRAGGGLLVAVPGSSLGVTVTPEAEVGTMEARVLSRAVAGDNWVSLSPSNRAPSLRMRNRERERERESRSHPRLRQGTPSFPCTAASPSQPHHTTAYSLHSHQQPLHPMQSWRCWTMGEGRPALCPELPENKAQPRPLVTPPQGQLGRGVDLFREKETEAGTGSATCPRRPS